MKVKIDRDGCIQCGLCSSTCPEVFEQEGADDAAIVEEYRTEGPGKGEVHDDLADCVEGAVEDCPVDVISSE